MKKRSQSLNLYVACMLLLCLITGAAANAQNVTIYGPDCVLPGQQVTYAYQGNWSTSTSMSWCISGGTIVTYGGTCKSGTPFPNITVLWGNGPNGSVSLNASTGSASKTIRFTTAMQGGTITANATQQITPGSVPATISVSLPTGGYCTTPSYVYRWEQSTDSINFYEITGAEGLNLSFTTALTQTTWYRRRAYETANGFSATSPVARVYVVAPLVAGTLSPTTQNVYAGTVPTQITVTAATGGACSGNYQYQWQSAPDGVNFTNIQGATAVNYPVPALSSTTHYRRQVTCGGNTLTTNSVAINVFPVFQPGVLSVAAATIPHNTSPGQITGTAASGGMCSGAYTYVWMMSQGDLGYTAIPNATGVNYTPANLSITTSYYRIATCGSEIKNSNVLTITVAPKFEPGIISAAALNIITGTAPGAISATAPSGGNCSGAYTYQWQSSANGLTWTTVQGATAATYTPPALTATTAYRRQVVCGVEAVYSNAITFVVHPGTAATINQNYVRTRTINRPLVTDNGAANALYDPRDVSQVTEYFDGLGRIVQKVSKQLGTDATPKDIVQYMQYDSFSRETYKYMPFASATAEGNYKTSPLTEQQTFNAAQFPGESNFYTLTKYEPSSLNRVFRELSPGANWAGSDRGTASQYMTNTSADQVKYWQVNSTGTYTVGDYSPGALYRIISIDEENKQVVEYKDRDDRVVLKKVQLATTASANHTGWLCTYFMYDDFDNLALVIPPKAVELLAANNWDLYYNANLLPEYCFEYKYDHRNRMTQKKVPGKKVEYTVYDRWDREVLKQDGELRKSNKWVFTKYDSHDRKVMTGFYTDNTNTTLEQMQAYVVAQTSLTRFEVRDNTKANNYTTDRSFPAIASPQMLTATWYDDYTWCSTQGVSAAKDNSFDSKLHAQSTNTWPFAQALNASIYVRGLETGSKAWLLDAAGTNFVVKVSFYNEKAQLTQTQVKHHGGGTDIVTHQYGFAGKEIATHLRHQKGGTNAQVHELVTKKTYDHAEHVTAITLKISSTTAADKPEQTIATYTYNNLNQVSQKKLGNSDSPVETLDYQCNVRGWLSGINKDYVKGSATRYFGMELGYDKAATVTGNAVFLTPKFDANVSGVIWKSKGDGALRKYDYQYDYADRLLKADFVQNPGTGTWSNSTVDYSVYGAPEHNNRVGYDANGNILSLFQNGLKLAGSGPVDKMRYAYLNNNVSNKLLSVTEDATIGTNDNKLGDFTDVNVTNDDYTYDDNGNLKTDKNKRITSITYNYMNLPVTITLANANGTQRGTIEYAYDAAGTRLSMKVTETGKPVKTVLYIGETVYENDSLKSISNDEGRIRYTKTAGSTLGRYDFDYFVKDHQNNIRMVLTEEVQNDAYPLLSFEGAAGSAEVVTQDNAYENRTGASIAVNSARVAWPAAYKTYNLPASGTVNDYGMLIKKSGGAIGAAKLLKVMAGDRIHAKVDYWYDVVNANNTNANGVQSIVSSLLSALGASGQPSALIKSNITTVTNSLTNDASLVSFLNTAPATSGRNQAPKAYLNVVFFDEQLKFDKDNSKIYPVAYISNKLKQTIDRSMSNAVSVAKNGYVYVYYSNETEEAVYFDNLQISHERGKLLEETHYYPFGLTMQGISSVAFKGPVYRENTTKFQAQEFDQDMDVDLYQFKWRNHDPQIGRFLETDPLASKYEYNSPYAFSENKITSHIELEGLEVDKPKYYGIQPQYIFEDGMRQVQAALAKLFSFKWEYHYNTEEETSAKVANVKASDVKTTQEYKKEYSVNLSNYLLTRGNDDLIKVKTVSGTQTKREEKISVDIYQAGPVTLSAIGKLQQEASGKTTVAAGLKAKVPLGPFGDFGLTNEAYGFNQPGGQSGVGFKTGIDATLVGRQIIIQQPIKGTNLTMTVTNTSQFKIGASFGWEFPW